MIITYLGKQFFKIAQGDYTIAVNPVGKGSDAKQSRFGADLVLSTMNTPDFNGLDAVTYGDKIPFAITGPGEYEVSGVEVMGVGSTIVLDKQTYTNTSYAIMFEGMKLAFLGSLATSLSAEAREEFMNPDILFIAPGGGELLDARRAYAFATSLEPKIIIPMDCEGVALDAFLKESGAGKVAPIEKLTIKKKEVETKVGEVVLLAV
jgi:L-ascorbate metabolism protein UlaG (beta-lactamase superfamily)